MTREGPRKNNFSMALSKENQVKTCKLKKNNDHIMFSEFQLNVYEIRGCCDPNTCYHKFIIPQNIYESWTIFFVVSVVQSPSPSSTNIM